MIKKVKIASSYIITDCILESQLNPNFDGRRECEHMSYDVRVFIFVGMYYNVSYTLDI